MGKRTKIVEIDEGEYVTIPHARHVLRGPGKLKVTRYDDGRVTGRILEGQAAPIEDAVDDKLVRRTWGV
jgi:hypothetical protein